MGDDGLFEELYDAVGSLFVHSKVSPWYAIWALKKVLDKINKDDHNWRKTPSFHKLDGVVSLLIFGIPLDMHDKDKRMAYNDGLIETTMTSLMMAIDYLDAGPRTINALHTYGERFSDEEINSGAAAEAVSMIASVELLQPNCSLMVCSYFNRIFSHDWVRTEVSNRRITKTVHGGTLLHMVCNFSLEEELPTRIRFLLQVMQVNPCLCDDEGKTAAQVVEKRLFWCKKGRHSTKFYDEAIRLLLRADPSNHHSPLLRQAPQKIF